MTHGVDLALVVACDEVRINLSDFFCNQAELCGPGRVQVLFVMKSNRTQERMLSLFLSMPAMSCLKRLEEGLVPTTPVAPTKTFNAASPPPRLLFPRQSPVLSGYRSVVLVSAARPCFQSRCCCYRWCGFGRRHRRGQCFCYLVFRKSESALRSVRGKVGCRRNDFRGRHSFVNGPPSMARAPSAVM